MTKTVLYARVSTASQTLAHQETQARAAGYELDEVVADRGVSGVATRLADRPEGRRLADMLRKGDTLVVRWLDRLGRNYSDVTETVQTLMKRGVIVRTIINQMVFDGTTKDPMQRAVRDALLGFMAAMGEAQAEATKEAQRAGIAHVQAKDGQAAYLGRKPSYTRRQMGTVDDMLGTGTTIAAISKATGLTRQTIYRLRDNRVEAEAALAAWGV
jgi:putative DNA-invertase from lambdoid prophage Rac